MSQNGTAESVYKAEPLFTKEQVTNMVMPELMANIKDQYDRSDEIERKYDGIITDPEDEHEVKRRLLTVDLLEISLVSIPMNEEARITAVKAKQLPLLPVVSGPSIASIHLAIARKRLERLGVLSA